MFFKSVEDTCRTVETFVSITKENTFVSIQEPLLFQTAGGLIIYFQRTVLNI